MREEVVERVAFVSLALLCSSFFPNNERRENDYLIFTN